MNAISGALIFPIRMAFVLLLFWALDAILEGPKVIPGPTPACVEYHFDGNGFGAGHWRECE